MEQIRAALGHHGHDTVGGAAELWSDVVALDAELLDGVLRRDITNRVDIAVVDWSSIDEGRAVIGNSTRNCIFRKSIALHAGYRVCCLGSALGYDAGGQLKQVEDIAAIQWQFGDRPARDYLANGCLLCFQKRRSRRDFYRLAHVANLECSVDAGGTLHLYHNVESGEALETGERNVDLVIAGNQIDELIFAASAGGGCAGIASVDIHQSHGCIWDHSTSVVGNGPHDGAGRLLCMECSMRQQQ